MTIGNQKFNIGDAVRTRYNETGIIVEEQIEDDVEIYVVKLDEPKSCMVDTTWMFGNELEKI